MGDFAAWRSKFFIRVLKNDQINIGGGFLPSK
jgi:hypothetical protein